MEAKLSIILPARNEAEGLGVTLPALREHFPDAEIIVVDDGSTDASAEIAAGHGALVQRHAYGKGNGAAIKTGARAASGQLLIFMDADGQHDPGALRALLDKLEQGYDMAVGARDSLSQASLGRRLGNGIYNRLASWMVGHRIEDLTSGLRAVWATKFREFLYLLPNGFSYPTTITMAFFRAGYTVGYVPIRAARRRGKSHIRPLQDSIRFLLIIFKITALYSPLKLFFPVSFMLFFTGVAYYIYTFLVMARFTNMSALLFITSVVVFLIGLVSEQITMLLYKTN